MKALLGWCKMQKPDCFFTEAASSRTEYADSAGSEVPQLTVCRESRCGAVPSAISGILHKQWIEEGYGQNCLRYFQALKRSEGANTFNASDQQPS